MVGFLGKCSGGAEITKENKKEMLTTIDCI